MMTTSNALHRLRGCGLTVLTAVLLLGIPASTAAAVDRNCATNASRDLSNQLGKAYDDYSEEMQQLSQQLSNRTQQAYSSSSGNGNNVVANQGVINSAYQEYSYGQNEANNRLGSKIYQAWNSYSIATSACDPSAPSATPYQNPYSGGQYQNQYYNYQYPYGGYQQYPYGMSYQYNGYNYGNQYQYPYNYYQQYPYDYNQGYGYSTGVQYYGNYGVQYNSNGQYICPQVVMSTLPSGCGYDCSLDSSGCRRCEVSCRRSAQRTESCGCAQTFRPVCGRDGVTYTNECFADCAGVEVRKMNVCN
ncbi:MAG TPA: Kazal-type serine protease inhibitor family protein [Candidatus Peribacteria bacterium]|nr:Kazal-type serine protease inhibitor family protein [Candidatus Peribacteria bacterium]